MINTQYLKQNKIEYITPTGGMYLTSIDDSLEICFYYTIMPLGLAAYLYVKDGRKPLLDVQEIA